MMRFKSTEQNVLCFDIPNYNIVILSCSLHTIVKRIASFMKALLRVSVNNNRNRIIVANIFLISS